MTWTAPEITRKAEPTVADERTMLQGWLDWHRQTLLYKCQGLTAEQLKRAAVPPSNLTLLGLVRHMAEVERVWFRRRVRGEDIGSIFGDRDEGFEGIEDADPEADFATLQAEIEAADAAAADVSLDFTFRHPRTGNEISVRWVYVHMIEEYARHNGHADLIRERIDGATGA